MRSHIRPRTMNGRASLHVLAACVLLVFVLAAVDAREPPTFEGDVLPVVQAYCVKCHGPDTSKAELDLTQPRGILKGGESGEPAVVIGSAEESPLYRMLAEGEMPPAGQPRPTQPEIDRLKLWIDSGALDWSTPAAHADAENALAKRVFDVLEWKCFVCHGRREKRGELDLRSLSAMLKGGKSGPAIVAGNAKSSALVARIHAGEMPPFNERYAAAVKPVSPRELEDIKQWIESGAPEPRYEVLGDEAITLSDDDRQWWAFQPPRRTPPPSVQAMELAHAPIDHFLLARLEQAGLTYSSEADRRALIRRLYDDLWGLPPEPDEVRAFVDDGSADAYERVVDRLLSSPRYGERWAQHWLDAAGFAESEGLESADPIFPEMYRYRDYVIRSLNADKSFDRFITEQLAGDELVDYRNQAALTAELAENIIATGFLRTAMDSTREPAVNFYSNRLQVLDDTVEIVSSNLLGLSLRCAKCHSHKYDPISQRDYYRFAAIFAAAYSPQDWLRPAERLLPLLTEAEEAELNQHNAKVQERIEAAQKRLDESNQEYLARLREKKLASLPAEVQGVLRQAMQTPDEQQTDDMKKVLAEHREALSVKPEDLPGEFADYAAAVQPLQEAVEEVKAELRTVPRAHALTDVTADAAPFYLLNRGEWNRRGARVAPGVPAVIGSGHLPYKIVPPPTGNTTGRRLALAQWLTRPEHPLTARVFVNRVWEKYFGRGIVPTVGDFGRAGQLPSHPELLDHLALEFIESGWSVKELHRSIVLSAAYRQSSRVREEAAAVDPENHWLWRMPLRRRDAESLRDGVMQIAGTLTDRMYGPSSPLETRPDGQVATPKVPEERRRSIYMLHRRLTPETILETFDAPRMSTNCLERPTSTVVNQALLLMHSAFMEAQAQQLAERARATAGEEAGAQIECVYELVLARPPSSAERSRAAVFLQHPAGTSDMLAELSLVLLNSAEFLYVD